MFNVLPENFKETIRKQYGKRRATVWLVGVIVLQCIGIILLVPSYLRMYVQEQDIEASISPTAVANTQDDAQITGVFAGLNKKISVLSSFSGVLPPSDPIAELVSLKGSSVVLNEITYQITTGTSSAVTVSGVASTRDALLAFSKRLEADNMFSGVDLPVSSFAKDTHIKFSLNMNAGGQQTAQ